MMARAAVPVGQDVVGLTTAVEAAPASVHAVSTRGVGRAARPVGTLVAPVVVALVLALVRVQAGAGGGARGGHDTAEEEERDDREDCVSIASHAAPSEIPHIDMSGNPQPKRAFDTTRPRVLRPTQAFANLFAASKNGALGPAAEPPGATARPAAAIYS